MLCTAHSRTCSSSCGRPRAQADQWGCARTHPHYESDSTAFKRFITQGASVDRLTWLLFCSAAESSMPYASSSCCFTAMASVLVRLTRLSLQAQPVRRPCVLCQAGPGPSSTRQAACSTAQPEQGRGLSRVLPALLAAAVTAVAPAAIAVSGGGGERELLLMLMLTNNHKQSAERCSAGLGTALSYKDFSGKSFPQQKFYKAELRGTNFSGADLTGANLYGAYAKDANFKDANMRLTVLESVDFENAGASVAWQALRAAAMHMRRHRLTERTGVQTSGMQSWRERRSRTPGSVRPQRSRAATGPTSLCAR